MNEPNGNEITTPDENDINLVTGEPTEPDSTNKLNWERYRELADAQAIGVRKVGLLDKKLALEAIKDDRTITLSAECGDLPVLCPIEYAAGFDVERAENIAAGNTNNLPGEVYYFCLPPRLLDGSGLNILIDAIQSKLSGRKMSIYFDFVDRDPVSRNELIHILNLVGFKYTDIPLRDERASEGFRDVTINYYRTITSRTDTSTTKLVDGDIYDAFQIACELGEFNKYPNNGPTILKGSEIPQQLVDKLWLVYQNRFEWLGENHPISMEENKEDFEKLLRSPGVSACIYFKDNKPVCWTYFTSNSDSEVWLNQAFITDQVEPGTYPLFFPGIVAAADNLGGYSEPTLQLAAKMVGRVNKNFTVMFETTNVSEEYIPKLVKNYADSSGAILVTEPERVDNTHYSLMSVN